MRTYPFISNYLQSSGWELAKYSASTPCSDAANVAPYSTIVLIISLHSVTDLLDSRTNSNPWQWVHLRLRIDAPGSSEGISFASGSAPPETREEGLGPKCLAKYSASTPCSGGANVAPYSTINLIVSFHSARDLLDSRTNSNPWQLVHLRLRIDLPGSSEGVPFASGSAPSETREGDLGPKCLAKYSVSTPCSGGG